MPNYKTFGQTAAADAQNNANIMPGEWVKKQDILYEALVVYDCRVWQSQFAKPGENKETATFQLRFEKDVDALPEDDLPFMLCSFDSARVVNMAHALIESHKAASTEDDSPFPFVAVLIEDTSATWVHDQFGQFPIVFADPTPENLTRPVLTPKQTPTKQREATDRLNDAIARRASGGPASQPRGTTSARR